MTEKAKRRLSNFNFEDEGSHVALVGPSVGGAANSWTTLITKSTNNITEDQVNKATMVTVELTIHEFLSKFFDMWYDDAEVLARIMGFDTSPDDEADSVDWWDAYIEDRVSAVTIMKSLVLDKSEEEVNKAIASLKPEDLIELLEVQKQFEQNLSSPEGVKLLKGTNTSSVEKSNNKGTKMTEFVTKAVHEAEILKAASEAVAAKEVELQKALEQITAFQAEKKEVIAKARAAAISEVEKDEKAAEALLKSLEAVSDESFEVVIKSLKAKEEKLEDSDLFVKKSKNTEVEEPESENATSAILKAKYAKQ